ncbi:alpha/beta fold hydrolase [Temperatibacter marinus]|uniref:Alpha/beta fold hydrolase n=1 Tax=Temperatibacter marinus TaxID=1456591 RepID=A0AA52EFN0_9PROT|nr:alpha/beta fold hydrolase [Temperatibacter marinus]WND01662.1 alpha/beta fold hydrolase [Temperatibacter marinus]
MKCIGRPLKQTVAPFKSRFPWWGADLQTIRSSLYVEEGITETYRLAIPIDGDNKISVAVNDPSEPWTGKLLLLSHGMGGTEGSGYMRRTARYFLDRGWKVARLNMRGAGKSAETSAPPYHAGLTGDLSAVLTGLTECEPEADIFLMGFSLGGNLTLKYLAEGDVPENVKAAVSISAPIDLTAASAVLSKKRNALYVTYLVNQLKRDLKKAPSVMAPDALEKIRFIRELDDQLIAPSFSFKDRFDYYEQMSAGQFMHRIKTPTLAIHSEDDPWIPYETYLKAVKNDHPFVSILLTEAGGHVGFFGKGSKINWFIPVAYDYFISESATS